MCAKVDTMVRRTAGVSDAHFAICKTAEAASGGNFARIESGLSSSLPALKNSAVVSEVGLSINEFVSHGDVGCPPDNCADELVALSYFWGNSNNLDISLTPSRNRGCFRNQ